MFGGLGKGFDPKKMQAVMKQLGMSQEEIEASRVVIETENGKIIIEEPSVSKISVQGQETFQISGKVKEEISISKEDIETISEKPGVSKEKAREMLEETNGDLAEAILKLS